MKAPLSNTSVPCRAQGVQFIILACAINLSYTIIYRQLGPEVNTVDLAALQAFQMVANERSYSRAAENLLRTQPAVSIAIRELEDWLRQPLIVRRSGARTLPAA